MEGRGVKVRAGVGKGFAYAATYLKPLSTKIIFIWSSLRAEYAQMMFKEHKQGKSGKEWCHYVLFYEEVGVRTSVSLLCACGKGNQERESDSWVNKQRREDSCLHFLYPSEMGYVYTQLLYSEESEPGDQISSQLILGNFLSSGNIRIAHHLT